MAIVAKSALDEQDILDVRLATFFIISCRGRRRHRGGLKVAVWDYWSRMNAGDRDEGRTSGDVASVCQERKQKAAAVADKECHDGGYKWSFYFCYCT